jgi:fumarate reductase subunit C
MNARRASALVLAVCVLVHLATIVYAVRGGLGAAEILGRTRGSYAWASFYAVFVLAASVHAGIGLRTIAFEWLGLRGARLSALVHLVVLLIAVLGLRAVWAVFG